MRVHCAVRRVSRHTTGLPTGRAATQEVPSGRAARDAMRCDACVWHVFFDRLASDPPSGGIVRGRARHERTHTLRVRPLPAPYKQTKNRGKTTAYPTPCRKKGAFRTTGGGRGRPADGSPGTIVTSPTPAGRDAKNAKTSRPLREIRAHGALHLRRMRARLLPAPRGSRAGTTVLPPLVSTQGRERREAPHQWPQSRQDGPAPEDR